MADLRVQLLAVEKSFGARQLFTGIHTAVSSGECLSIVGANGSGKSTLLKIIAGFIRPSSGRVEITADGSLLDAEQRITMMGLVSPEMTFYHPLSAYENIRFFLTAQARELSPAIIREHLDNVGLKSQAAKPVAFFSTGMKQRLKFALLLALDPPLLLLDEPASNLDTNGKQMVAAFISAALAAKKTIIIASNESWETEYGTQTIILS